MQQQACLEPKNGNIEEGRACVALPGNDASTSRPALGDDPDISQHAQGGAFEVDPCDIRIRRDRNGEIGDGDAIARSSGMGLEHRKRTTPRRQ